MPFRLVAVAGLLALVFSAVGAAMVPRGGDSPGGSASTPAGDSSGSTFVLTGSGYGHGVGLSQYGARAQAAAGRTAEDILGFYYPGTAVGPTTKATIRVLLEPSAPALSISSAADFTVRDALGATYPVAAGTLLIGPDLQIRVNGVLTPLTGPVSVVPGRGALLQLGGKSYRGTLELAAVGNALRAIDVVSLEGYVQGVVPGEMPSSWPAAALQAQAIAARSYAVAGIAKGQPWDVYPDGRSQQYLGASAETPQTTAAVKATAHQVVLYAGAVATTFYSSSDGGRTASGLDVFGLDLPYLPSQLDPWDDGSPYHVWPSTSYSGTTLAKALGMRSSVVEVRSQLSSSLRVTSLVAIAADGSSLGLSGAEVRKRLGLRSTAFRLGTLRFVTPASPTTTGTKVRLAGLARDVDAAALERLDASGSWVPVLRQLVVQPDGSFAAVVRPKQTTTYRLSAAGIPGPELTIPVVPAAG